MVTTKKAPPQVQMFTLIMGRWVSHLIYLAATLKLADFLRDRPRTVEELATVAGVQAPALYRVLRALASVGIFAETKRHQFKLTPLASTLQETSPGSMRAIAIMMGEKYHGDSWAQLLPGLKTGEVPFYRAHGVPYFQYLHEHAEDFRIFCEAMTNVSAMENPAIAAAYKFAKIRTLVDVGGGNGSLLATILHANPKLKGVLFDLPAVNSQAEQDHRLAANGIAQRCTLKAGDFFKAVPTGGDAYLVKRVLHDWNDEQCVKILANCCAAMNENGRVLVLDSVIPPGNAPDRGKLMDIQMLVIGGRERTKEEFAALFRKAGLKLTRVLPTKCPLSIVEGVRA